MLLDASDILTLGELGTEHSTLLQVNMLFDLRVVA